MCCWLFNPRLSYLQPWAIKRSSPKQMPLVKWFMMIHTHGFTSSISQSDNACKIVFLWYPHGLKKRLANLDDTWRLFLFANSGYEIMLIAHIDLFPDALFNLFHTICWEVHPLLTSPGIKVKKWKSERMQAPYKEQKASNAIHLPLYWNVLSFSFTIIEFFLAISFWVAMQYTFIVYFL